MKLYHYTDVGAVRSVLESGFLWASDIRYLNDHSEYRDGESKIQQIFEEKNAGLSPANAEKIRQNFSSCLDSSKSSYTMICSLSQGEDLLSQWRGYCPRAGGYALEFTLEDQRNFGAPLHQCVYDEKAKAEAGASLFDLAERVVVKRKGNKSKLFQTTWSNIAKFKNAGFSEERELRLIIFMRANDPKVLFRTRDNLIVPYMHVELPYNKLSAVWVGPCPNAELAVTSLKGFISSLALKPGHYFASHPAPEIKVSSITFRG